MKMEYKLIKSAGKGFILTRQPETVENELFISFTGAPKDATAIFENKNGNSLYRLLEDGLCSVPADFLDGVIHVTVVQLNGAINAEKYHCESIYTTRKQGVLFVIPNGIDIPLQIVEILEQLQEIKQGLTSLDGKYKKQSLRLDKLIEGHDFD